MDYPTIVKPGLDDFSVRPNLDAYDDLRQTFSWQELRQELDGLPGGGLNLAHEAIDRHAAGGRGDKVAMYWEGAGGEEERYTFADMRDLTNRFANVLQGLGVEKGDRVFIFMGRVPELYVAFFGILKAGAIAGPAILGVRAGSRAGTGWRTAARRRWWSRRSCAAASLTSSATCLT